jgi:hypothetical protein
MAVAAGALLLASGALLAAAGELLVAGGASWISPLWARRMREPKTVLGLVAMLGIVAINVGWSIMKGFPNYQSQRLNQDEIIGVMWLARRH